MNFFERQREVRSASKRLVLLFAAAVLAITAAVNIAVIGATLSQGATVDQIVGLVIVVSGLTLVLIGTVSVVKLLMLRHGGGVAVAESLGAVRLPDHLTDPQLKRYRNVVEEISIASSTPVPVLFVLPDEPGINAFAAGYTPADAAVCVTQGSLDRLNRDELQGVIAHEFSHIVNGDMRLSIRLIGVLAGITALAVVGRIMLQSGAGSRRSDDSKGALPFWALGLILMILGWIGVFFGRLIKAAISRQREYLADASAVQFTRQTAGLAGALKKIGGLDAGSKLHSPRTENVSHMLFGEGMNFSALYATHPPLIERIKELEPGFTAEGLDHLHAQWQSAPPNGLAEDAALGLAAPQDGGLAPQQVRLNADAVVATVGSPKPDDYESGTRILNQIPDELIDLAHNPNAVIPLMFGLLLDRDANIRNSQLTMIGQTFGNQVVANTMTAANQLAALDPQLRLAIAELSFPAMRRRTPDEIRAVLSLVGQLVNADGKVSVFEYCLGTLVYVGLHEALNFTSPWKSRRQNLGSAQNAIACLLAVLAITGNRDQQSAERAFRSGISTVYPNAQLPLLPVPQGVLALEAVWPVVDGLQGNDKALIVEAVVNTVMSDGVATLDETELVRTVCGVLHCPVPPLN
ncbi:MAG: M48 family metallopeptidase [Nocardiaceae bacterium]|nr:M48 family metallopeptidase [Nocardiaceae bacterium]